MYSMLFRSFILTSFIASTVDGQVVPPPGGCLICGDGSGQVVTNLDAIFLFINQPDVPCGDLQTAGVNGQIPLDQCPFLPSLIKV